MPGDDRGEVTASGTSRAGLRCGVGLSRWWGGARSGAHWGTGGGEPRTGGVGWEGRLRVLIGRMGDEDIRPLLSSGGRKGPPHPGRLEQCLARGGARLTGARVPF